MQQTLTTLSNLTLFAKNDCIPAEATYNAQMGKGEDRWKVNKTSESGLAGNTLNSCV